MKKIILIFIIIGIYSFCQAKPWYDYDVYTNPADGDHFLINDISETGPPDNNAAGTLKRLPWSIVQPRDSDLTSLAAIAFSANMLSFLDAADYAEMKTLLSIPMQADCSGITAGLCLDTDTGELYSWDGDSVELVGVLNWQALHANLTAIADAEAGVISPGITMYDDNGTGTGTAFIYGTTVDDNKDVVMSIGVEEEGSETPAVYIELDGINERVNALKPLNLGRFVDWININDDATIDLDIDYPDICDLTLIVWDSVATLAIEFELWNNALCNGIANYGKRFCVLSRTDSITMTIDPDDADKLSFHTFALGDAGDHTSNTSDALGDGICLVGGAVSATQYWTNEPGSVIGTWSSP